MYHIPSFGVEMSKKREEKEAYFRLIYYFSKDFIHLNDLIKNSVGSFEARVEYISNPNSVFEEIYREEILKNGFMRFLSGYAAMEGVISPSISIDEIESIFRKFVEGICVSSQLIVIDPYFFAENKVYDIYDLFFRILSTASGALKKMIIVHDNNKVNKGAVEYFSKKLSEKYPKAVLVRAVTNTFHDRFWINPVAGKGIIVGTSLNGIGKKISVVDKLSDSDTKNIILELNKNTNLKF